MRSSGKSIDQKIAIFGESGSGKTVLTASFYGSMQQEEFHKHSLLWASADSASDNGSLMHTYLEMKEDAVAPPYTRFNFKSYGFTFKPSNGGIGKGGQPAGLLRLVWDDYPGEWFEQDPSSATEEQRRIESFKTLVTSDVAFILVDGQKLIDYEGEEERYFKKIFTDMSQALLKAEDQILEGGKPLVRFPRIWVLALSKADLHPNLDVHGFRNLAIKKAASGIDDFRKIIERYVESPEALSVCEDFLLLSSAKFTPGKIDVSTRTGVDLILPLAALLPLQHALQWQEKKTANKRVMKVLLEASGSLVLALGFMQKWLKKGKGKGGAKAAAAIGALLAASALIEFTTEQAKDRLEAMMKDAVERGSFFEAVIARFAYDLAEAEEKGILLRSRR